MTCRWPGNLTVTDAVPCGPTNSTFPVVPCCGERDQCVTDNLCRYSRSRVGGSGYYIAGCTASDDGAFDDNGSFSNVCVNRCSNKRYPDVIYTPEKNQWSCCGSGKNGSRGCDNPTDSKFPASAPASLVSYGPNLNSKSHASSSGLSTGAKVGIGVGVGVGGLILIIAAVVAFLFLRRRKRNANASATVAQEGRGVVDDTKKMDAAVPAAYKQTYPAELAQEGPVIQELPAGNQSVAQELPAGHGHDIQELPTDNWAK